MPIAEKKMKLTYFAMKGMGEVMRLAMVLGDIDFEDRRIEFEKFDELKETGLLPFGQMPVLEVDGKVYSQSLAILRYLGKLTGMYPDDFEEAMYVDEVLSAVKDICNKIFGPEPLSEKERKVARESFLENELDQFVGGLERLAKAKSISDTWICGDAVSVADIFLYVTIGHITNGLVQFIPTDLFEKFPRLMACYREFSTLEKVVTWNSSHPWTA